MSMPNEIAPDFTQPNDLPGASTESLGAWLARARAGCGIEQRDAARRLRLNPAIIQAIETDDFAWLGPPVFVRGYLSRYAQLLDLPESAVLERYRLQSGPSQEPPLKVVHPLQRQTRIRDLRGLFYLIVVVGIGWTAVQHLGDLDPGRLTALWRGHGQNSGSQTTSSPPVTTTQIQYPFQPKPAEATSAPASPAPPVSEPPAITPESTPAPVIASLQLPAPVAPASPLERAPIPSAPEAGTVAIVPASSTTGSSLEATGAEARLLLEFSNDCWVEIKDAQGNVLASGLMKANSTRAIAGPTPFKVTLGNAPAARIVLDDRLVDAAVYVPRRGTVSRFTLDRGQP